MDIEGRPSFWGGGASCSHIIFFNTLGGLFNIAITVRIYCRCSKSFSGTLIAPDRKQGSKRLLYYQNRERLVYRDSQNFRKAGGINVSVKNEHLFIDKGVRVNTKRVALMDFIRSLTDNIWTEVLSLLKRRGRLDKLWETSALLSGSVTASHDREMDSPEKLVSDFGENFP